MQVAARDETCTPDESQFTDLVGGKTRGLNTAGSTGRQIALGRLSCASGFAFPGNSGL